MAGERGQCSGYYTGLYHHSLSRGKKFHFTVVILFVIRQIPVRGFGRRDVPVWSPSCVSGAQFYDFVQIISRVLDVLGGGLGRLLAARHVERDSQWPQQTGFFLS